MSGELRAASLATLTLLGMLAAIFGAPMALAHRPHYGISHARPVSFDDLQNLGIVDYRNACIAHNIVYLRLLCTYPGQTLPCYNFSMRLPETQLIDPTRVNETRVATSMCNNNIRSPFARQLLCCHTPLCLNECYQFPMIRSVRRRLNFTQVRIEHLAARRYWSNRNAKIGVDDG